MPAQGAAGEAELLRTARVLLRRWTEQDLDAFLAVYGRDEVTRWLGPHPRRSVATAEQARARLSRWREREAGLASPCGLWALVEHGRSTAPVGTVLLLPLSDAAGVIAQVEVGWHLHPERQGHGLVTEAATALLDAAAASGLTEVLALTDLDNARSQAVARRLGMVDEGPTDRWFGLTTRQFRAVLDSRTPRPTAGAADRGVRAGGTT